MSVESRVLLLHTGGTLGMVSDPLEPGPFGAQLLDAVPELARIARIEVDIVCNLDSSDLGPTEWTGLARTIASERGRRDGFVIVHGTDTMAFTAAALSFALRGLDRPVILTGAQRPLRALRTDARRNLADAVEVAALRIPGVAICFDGLLLRGTRTVKQDSRSYRAFSSPGVEPLARLGTDIAIRSVQTADPGPFRLAPDFEPSVDVVHVVPGLTAAGLERRLEDPLLKGVVLAAFGIGTVPAELTPPIAAAISRGVDVLAVTQWGGRVTLDLYPNSRLLRDAGVISGGAMRIEAAVPKLMHALANFPDAAERRAYLLTDIAGERD